MVISITLTNLTVVLYFLRVWKDFEVLCEGGSGGQAISRTTVMCRKRQDFSVALVNPLFIL